MPTSASPANPKTARKQRRPEFRLASATRRVAPLEAKRAAVILRRGMRQSEFRLLGAEFGARALTITPVLAGPNGDREAKRPDLCGLVVTGADGMPSPSELHTIDRAVRDMVARKLPVLALTEAVEPVLRAAGYAPAEEGVLAALIVNGELTLCRTQKELGAAIDVIAKTQVEASLH